MTMTSSRRRAAAARCLLWLLLPLLGGWAGCGRPGGMPRSPADIPGYLAPPPSLAEIDPAPLQGRRILLDAGHGGYFRGAVGPQGLSEAEVNLGVALYLQGMLRWAGAEVHLTRSADVDFLSPADSSLTADLAARIAICDSLAPEVFLSIHHNSTPDHDPTINETQTYYPLDRDGADLDLARAIHRRLVVALAIAPAQILPGNFYVLRHASVPAVLGEPAMLSHPVIERRLGLARSLELEASAYFLGLRDYFAAGTPRWLSALPDTIDLAARPGPLSWVFDAGSNQAPALDPATISLTVDDRPLPFQLDPAASTVHWLPGEAPREGRLELVARNLAGRATPRQVHVLAHRRNGPWRLLHISEAAGDGPPRALLTYHNEGQALHACGELLLGDAAGAGLRPLPVYAGRRGWLLIEPASARAHELRILERRADGGVLIHAESAPQLAVLPPGLRWVHLELDRALWRDRNVPGDGWRLRLPAAGGQSPDRLEAAWLDPRWPVVLHRQGEPLWLEAGGARPLLLAADGSRLGASGREPAAMAEALAWEPLLPALVGKRVAIDPRGGGTVDEGRGPLGTRGSDLNLMVARRLAASLRGVGCDVLLLRADETWLPDPRKISLADRFAADLYLAIGRGDPAVRHHFGSRLGAPWAVRCAEILNRLLPGEVAAQPASDYILRHTACPAILVDLEPPASAESEDRLRTSAWQDAEARALLLATAGLLEPEVRALDLGRMLADLGERALTAGRLDYGCLDGNLQWLPPGPERNWSLTSNWDGDPGLPGLGGRHFLELHAGPQWQLWELSRLPEDHWHGQLLMEGR